MKYTGRVALVTGTRKGVGRMVAEHFLAEGAVTVGLSRGPSSIDHPFYTHMQVDIGDSEAVRMAVLGCSRVDYVVNCAAVATSTYAMILPVAGAEEMTRTNILGLLYVARESAKSMRRAKFGRIINIGSIHARIAPIGASIYAATKAAQDTLVQVLSKEFASYGITVNTLSLSPIETDMLRASGTPDVIAKVIDGLTISRKAEPEDVFNGIDFLCAEESCFITGQTIYLGGVHA